MTKTRHCRLLNSKSALTDPSTTLDKICDNTEIWKVSNSSGECAFKVNALTFVDFLIAISIFAVASNFD
jgi:hypothetical protein